MTAYLLAATGLTALLGGEQIKVDGNTILLRPLEIRQCNMPRR
jgi:RNase P/RNase MRP subunit p29